MARKRWSGGGRTDRPSVRGLPPLVVHSPADQVRRFLCALCGRETKGFGYTHPPAVLPERTHLFCSMACLTAGADLVRRHGPVIDKTRMETQAIKDARRFFAEVLTEMGLLAPFHGRTPAEIDRVIEACVDGFHASMQRQAAAQDPIDDPIPF